MIIKKFNIVKERFVLYKKEIEKINNNKYISFFNKTKKIFRQNTKFKKYRK